MRWVTGQSVQAGRMMQGWLIRRFVDSAAEFVYAPDEKDLTGIDAKPFMIPGHPLAERVELVDHYQLVEKNPRLDTMLRIFVSARQAYLAMRDDGAALSRVLGPMAPPEAGGLATLLLGVNQLTTDPAERMRLGEEIFDALYAGLAVNERRRSGTSEEPARR